MAKLVVAMIAVALLLALAFVEVEVSSMNDDEGAVAYAQPMVNSTYFGGVSSNTLAGTALTMGPEDVSGVTLSIEAPIIEYLQEAPVKKPLWQVLVGGASLTDIGGGATDPMPGPGLPTCTVKSSDTGSFKITTYVELTVTAPGGEETVTRSPPVEWTVETTKTVRNCDDGSIRTTINAEGPKVAYEFGTYYFTQGWGTYDFQGKVFRQDPELTGNDDQIGALLVSVDVTPEGAGSG